MKFIELVIALAISCFLLGLVIGFFAKNFWDKYCSIIEEGTEDVVCEEDEDDYNEDYD